MRSFTIETLREIIAQRDEALLERFEVELNRCDQVELNFRSSLGFIEEGFNKQQYQAFIEALKRNKTISSVNLSYLSVEEFKNEFREGIAELLTDNKVIKN